MSIIYLREQETWNLPALVLSMASQEEKGKRKEGREREGALSQLLQRTLNLVQLNHGKVLVIHAQLVQ